MMSHAGWEYQKETLAKVEMSFADQRGLQAKINLFGGAMVNQQKEFTSPFNPVQLWTSGNFIVKLWPYILDLGIPLAGKVEEKKELKSLLKWGE